MHGSGEIQHHKCCTLLWHRSIRVVQHFGKDPGIAITLVPSIHPQLQDRFLILISFHGSHTTIANTIKLHGELPL